MMRIGNRLRLALLLALWVSGLDAVIGQEDRDSIDSELFGSAGKQAAYAQCRRHMEQRLNQLELICGLRPEQQEKLWVGFAGDWSRFELAIVDAKSIFSEPPSEDRIKRLVTTIKALRDEYQRLIQGRGNLYLSLVDRTVGPDQREQIEHSVRTRAKRRLDAAIDYVVLELQAKLSLVDAQRSKVADLLQRKAAEEAFSEGGELILIRKLVRKIPAGDWREILDANQITTLASIHDPQKDFLPVFRRLSVTGVGND